MELGETAEDGVRREMKEETGLDVTVRGIITVIDLFGCTDQTKVWNPAMDLEDLDFHFLVVEYLSSVCNDAKGLQLCDMN